MNKKTVLITARRHTTPFVDGIWPSRQAGGVRVLLERGHNENNNEERRDQDDHDALHRWRVCRIPWARGHGHNSTYRRSTYRASHPGRRGRYAARHRRGQARICHLRHVETGGARGDFAPAAPGRFGADRRPDGRNGRGIRRCRAVRPTNCRVRRQRVCRGRKGAPANPVDTRVGTKRL